jgi:hypothetical protein
LIAAGIFGVIGVIVTQSQVKEPLQVKESEQSTEQ